jgi:UDP-N-acetylglucosamine 4,6-dehydratase/5-epimerase
MNWEGKEILITGGTGSLGSTLVRKILDRMPKVKGVRVYSRDEAKQSEMRKGYGGAPVAFIIGDVRDRRRLLRAMQGCHVVIHTAALKHVPVAEENPLEYIRTNVDGTLNVIECCLDAGVERAMFISTDKAVYPINLYGATKMCAERAWIRANLYAGGRPPLFSACRYGNVWASRGSVIGLWVQQARAGQPLTVTDPDMTRFWFTLDQASSFVLKSLTEMAGGEIFVPKMPSMRIRDLVQVVSSIYPEKRGGFPHAATEVTGLRPGEKMDECLITLEESLSTVRSVDGYIILQDYRDAVRKPFTLTSANNDWWLEPTDVRRMLP